MNEKSILMEAMKSVGWTQKTLAESVGLNSQQAVGNRLTTGKSMRVDTFVKMLSAMGYEVVVQSKSPNVNKNRWTVGEE